MKLALVGVGGAGSRIVDRIRGRERSTGRNVTVGNVIAFDTAQPEGGFDAMPDDQCVVIGDTHPEVAGEGVDGDADLAAEVTREELPDVRRALDFIEVHDLDGVLLVAGLGGGTGSGMGSVLLDELKTLYEKPVYALGVLPGEDEGGRPALNAARSLRSFVETADNVLLFDNAAWCSDAEDSPEEYERANGELATRVVALLGTGERDGAKVPENAVDSSDLARALETGGVSSIGYASIRVGPETHRLLSWLRGLIGNGEDEGPVEPAEIKRLFRRAVESDLTLPCGVDSAERTVVVLSGPSAKLSRRGFESARYWLEEETDTVELRAGDEPNEGASRITAAVLLSNVTDVPRIDAMQEQAVAHQNGMRSDGSGFRWSSK